ncbi:MAG: hypothetical protein ACYSUP_05520 [Planctomycetota bacterium]
MFWLNSLSMLMERRLAMRTDKITPSGGYYILSAAIASFGAILWLVFFFILFFSITESIIQVVVPGVHRLKLPSPGQYTIYHEYRSVVGSRSFATDKNVALHLVCSIEPADRAGEIAVSATSPHAKYEIDGRRAVSIFKFQIDQPGEYVLTAKYPGGEERPQVVLGIARRLAESLFVPGILLTLFSTGTILLSACIFWITFYKRRKAKKRIFQTNIR